MKPSIALGIPHLLGNPEREERMDRIASALGIDRQLERGPGTLYNYREFTEKAPNRVWARAMWRWGFETGADAFLTLQDDSEVMPEGFWPALRAMLTVVPRGGVLSLASVHPGARELLNRGHRWYRTSSWVIGWGYLLWREDLEALLEHDAQAQITGRGATDNEDSFVNRFVAETARSTWHPVPAIVDHQADLVSTYGNDEHIFRRASVRWEGFSPRELAAPAFWRLQSPEPPPRLALPKSAHIQIDDCKYRVSVCTPVRGGMAPQHVTSLLAMFNIRGVEVKNDASVNFQHEQEDLVRVRSRMLRRVHASDATHMLFGDADVSYHPNAVAGMLVAGKEFVQTPYPRRDGLKYTILPLEEHVARGRWTDADIEKPANVIRIRGTGLGLTLVSRSCMERMIAHYGNEPVPVEQLLALGAGVSWAEDGAKPSNVLKALTAAYELGRLHGHRLSYLDLASGQPELTVALFQLLIRDQALMSEDMSFCTRWRETPPGPDGKAPEVYLYVGEGSPATHWLDGVLPFEGKLEHLALSYGTKGKP